jgi:hypothetical protein
VVGPVGAKLEATLLVFETQYLAPKRRCGMIEPGEPLELEAMLCVCTGRARVTQVDEETIERNARSD